MSVIEFDIIALIVVNYFKGVADLFGYPSILASGMAPGAFPSRHNWYR